MAFWETNAFGAAAIDPALADPRSMTADEASKVAIVARLWHDRTPGSLSGTQSCEHVMTIPETQWTLEQLRQGLPVEQIARPPG